jgi:hypothetical protein
MKTESQQQVGAPVRHEATVTGVLGLGSTSCFQDISWESGVSSSNEKSFLGRHISAGPRENSILDNENASPSMHVSYVARVPPPKTSQSSMVAIDDGPFELALETHDMKVWQLSVEDEKLDQNSFKNHWTAYCRNRCLGVVVMILGVVVLTSIWINLRDTRRPKSIQSSEANSSQHEPFSANDFSTNASYGASMQPVNETLALTQAQTTVSPASNPTFPPKNIPVQVPSFGVVADAPNSQAQRKRLVDQMLELNDSIDFLVHVGDIRSAEAHNGVRPDCMLEDYNSAAKILRRSPVPVFVVMGTWASRCCSFEHSHCLVLLLCNRKR